MKKAFITGITGQDGSYLAELLLSKGYEVHGLIRRTSTFNRCRIDHLYHPDEKEQSLLLHYGDLSDASSLGLLLQQIVPDEVYNLAAQSHVRVSFEVPEYTADTDALGVLRLLEAVRVFCPHARFYQASTSELFGKVRQIPQTEETPFYPRSPYGVAKMYGFWMTKNYREAYGLHASNGILFNHESPRRGESFVTRKITMAVARISRGIQDCLYIGNLDAKRDWGYAPDYVKMMWLMMQQEEPDDYVAATGEMHSVREFTEKAFAEVGHHICWHGKGIDEIGIDSLTNKTVVRINPAYFRPTEVDQLLGNAKKAKEKLGWTPSVKFEELVSIMVKGDLRLLDDPRYSVGF